jgi:hypothetical protein
MPAHSLNARSNVRSVHELEIHFALRRHGLAHAEHEVPVRVRPDFLDARAAIVEPPGAGHPERKGENQQRFLHAPMMREWSVESLVKNRHPE